MNTRTVDRDVAQGLLKALDISVLFSIALAAAVTSFTEANPESQSSAVYLAMVASLATVLAIRTLGAYNILRWRDIGFSAGWSILSAALIGVVCLVISAPTSWTLSPGWLIAWSLPASIYLLVSRVICYLWARRRAVHGTLMQRVAVVGGGAAAEEALNLLTSSTASGGVEIVGLFDDRSDDRSPESIRHFQKIGRIGDLKEFARQKAVDLIIVAIPMSAEKRLLTILKQLWELPVDIRISAASSELRLSPSAYTYLGALPLLNVFERPLRGWDAVMKSVMDRIIAAIAIVLLAPVMAGVALAVRWDSKGPVLFKQKRHGFNNELIEVYKFRSMYVDMSDATAAKLVTKDDPRVTRVGRFIRKTSLDELPQLFNVIRGELSLVGPRPHATQAKAAGTLYDQVVEGYFARHKVKPGITGWAQINGWRGETDTHDKLQQRVKHDLEYIDRWSLVFDLYILAKTPFSLLKSENAY